MDVVPELSDLERGHKIHYEKGWVDLKHPRFGDEQMYYHENFYNIRLMDGCHFSDANRLSEYLSCWERANPH